MIISLIGVAGWALVAIIWHDRALIVVNAMAIFIYLTGVVKFLMKGGIT